MAGEEGMKIPAEASAEGGGGSPGSTAQLLSRARGEVREWLPAGVSGTALQRLSPEDTLRLWESLRRQRASASLRALHSAMEQLPPTSAGGGVSTPSLPPKQRQQQHRQTQAATAATPMAVLRLQAASLGVDPSAKSPTSGRKQRAAAEPQAALRARVNPGAAQRPSRAPTPAATPCSEGKENRPGSEARGEGPRAAAPAPRLSPWAAPGPHAAPADASPDCPSAAAPLDQENASGSAAAAAAPPLPQEDTPSSSCRPPNEPAESTRRPVTGTEAGAEVLWGLPTPVRKLQGDG
eukprot:jgi/Tetstr1/429016/TSEL_001877.t1